MFILETMFTLFLLTIVISVVEVISLSIKGQSFILSIYRKITSTKFNLFKSKTNTMGILKEIKNKLSKYEDKYSNWDKKVGRFQLEVYYEVEKIIDILDNANDETQMEFNTTYRETVSNIYKLLKENEFIVTKKEHDEVYLILKELRDDAKDILTISNKVNSVKKDDLINIEMEYIKLQRENRKYMMED